MTTPLAATDGNIHGINGFNSATWQFNAAVGEGQTATPAIANNVLTITDTNYSDFENHSTFTTAQYPIVNAAGFTASFVYTDASRLGGNGFTFTIQNQGAAALGAYPGGKFLGYSGMAPSAAVEFNIWTSASLNDTGGTTNPGPNPGSVTAFATGGAILVNSYTTAGAHLTTPAVDMTSGHPIQVVLSYNGAARP